MSVFGKLFGDPSIGPAEKLWAVVNNMIPVLGVLLLGWEAGPVLLLLWLDGWLGVWEIAAVAAVDASREKDPAFSRVKGIKKAILWGFVFLLAGGLLSIPSIIAWVAVGTLILDHYDHGLFSVLLSGRTVLWAVAVNILFRAAQTAFSFRRRGGEKAGFTLEEKFHFLIFKAFGMLLPANWLGAVGTSLLTAYVVFVSALFAWMELNPGRFLHLVKVGGGAGPGPDGGREGGRKKRRRGADPSSSGGEGRGLGPER